MAIDISSISSVSTLGSLNNILTGAEKSKEGLNSGGISSFEALLQSAQGLIKETEDYTNAAEQAELAYMLGINDSISDLLVAQTKANVSLQYTVAVRNAVMDAYKEIMALQF